VDLPHLGHDPLPRRGNNEFERITHRTSSCAIQPLHPTLGSADTR
jgi:hypothetical protein